MTNFAVGQAGAPEELWEAWLRDAVDALQASPGLGRACRFAALQSAKTCFGGNRDGAVVQAAHPHAQGADLARGTAELR